MGCGASHGEEPGNPGGGPQGGGYKLEHSKGSSGSGGGAGGNNTSNNNNNTNTSNSHSSNDVLRGVGGAHAYLQAQKVIYHSAVSGGADVPTRDDDDDDDDDGDEEQHHVIAPSKGGHEEEGEQQEDGDHPLDTESLMKVKGGGGDDGRSVVTDRSKRSVATSGAPTSLFSLQSASTEVSGPNGRPALQHPYKEVERSMNLKKQQQQQQQPNASSSQPLLPLNSNGNPQREPTTTGTSGTVETTVEPLNARPTNSELTAGPQSQAADAPNQFIESLSTLCPRSSHEASLWNRNLRGGFKHPMFGIKMHTLAERRKLRTKEIKKDQYSGRAILISHPGAANEPLPFPCFELSKPGQMFLEIALQTVLSMYRHLSNQDLASCSEEAKAAYTLAGIQLTNFYALFRHVYIKLGDLRLLESNPKKFGQLYRASGLEIFPGTGSGGKGSTSQVSDGSSVPDTVTEKAVAKAAADSGGSFTLSTTSLCRIAKSELLEEIRYAMKTIEAHLLAFQQKSSSQPQPQQQQQQQQQVSSSIPPAGSKPPAPSNLGTQQQQQRALPQQQQPNASSSGSTSGGSLHGGGNHNRQAAALQNQQQLSSQPSSSLGSTSNVPLQSRTQWQQQQLPSGNGAVRLQPLESGVGGQLPPLRGTSGQQQQQQQVVLTPQQMFAAQQQQLQQQQQQQYALHHQQFVIQQHPQQQRVMYQQLPPQAQAQQQQQSQQQQFVVAPAQQQQQLQQGVMMLTPQQQHQQQIGGGTTQQQYVPQQQPIMVHGGGGGGGSSAFDVRSSNPSNSSSTNRLGGGGAAPLYSNHHGAFHHS